MATVKKDYIIKLMEDEQLAYWRIADGGSNKIGENDVESNVGKGIELMEDCLSYIEDTRINVVLSNRCKKDKAAGGRGYKQYEFAVKLQDSTNRTADQGINGTVIALLKELYDTKQAVAIQQKDFEMKELQRRFDELERGNDKPDVMERGFGMLEKYFAFNSAKPAASISGINDGPVNDDIVTKQRKIKEAIKRLAVIDPHIQDTLTVLATFAEKNKEQYFSSLQMIKGMI